MTPVNQVLNLSAYRFVSLPDGADWQRRITDRAAAAGLRGTVLIAPEGLNLFIAGVPGEVRSFWTWLTAAPSPFAGLRAKESWSARVPFGRLRVALKAEIIRMNHPTVRPDTGRAPSVDAPTLARWLARGVDDAGRELVMLDTRNAFEVAHGRFDGALDWQLSKFSDFPAALAEHRPTLEGKTVVSYCTGGIRCEKAALLMRDSGLENVFQLDGGILQYFETVGGERFQGTCFVFDDRVTLNDTLVPVQGA